MRYVSTRGQAPTLGFLDAMLTGLARDGGLYAPETLPEMTPEAIRALAGVPYAKAAARIVAPFVEGEIAPGELEAMAEDAYAGFRHAARRRSSRSTTICSSSNCFTARRWRSRTSPCSGSAA